jgi:hypothetical protein
MLRYFTQKSRARLAQEADRAQARLLKTADRLASSAAERAARATRLRVQAQAFEAVLVRTVARALSGLVVTTADGTPVPAEDVARAVLAVLDEDEAAEAAEGLRLTALRLAVQQSADHCDARSGG